MQFIELRCKRVRWLSGKQLPPNTKNDEYVNILLNTDRIIYVVNDPKIDTVDILVSKPGDILEVLNVVNFSFEELSSYLTDSVFVPEHAYA